MVVPAGYSSVPWKSVCWGQSKCWSVAGWFPYLGATSGLCSPSSRSNAVDPSQAIG